MLKEWLLNGDKCISYLVSTHLLEENLIQLNDGYVKQYLDLYDKKTKTWGNGFYGPKWISSTYTLLDLVTLEVQPEDKTKEAFQLLRKNIVQRYTLNPSDERTLDLCIVGMLIKIGSYLNVEPKSQNDLIDFLLLTINDDGAWNCFYNYRDYKTSSLHTTINILEGLVIYKDKYKYRLDEVINAMNSANEFILKKKVFRSRRTGKIIRDDFTQVHYPTRWKSDYFRTMEYFASIHLPYDPRMEESLSMLKKLLSKGPLPKGKTYTGKVHFKFALDDYKRINTYRALKVLKEYDETYFKDLMEL